MYNLVTLALVALGVPFLTALTILVGELIYKTLKMWSNQQKRYKQSGHILHSTAARYNGR